MNFSHYSQTWCVDDDSTREPVATSNNGEGRRIEGMGIVAEMEQLPDGSQRLTVTMDGAQKLAVSAAAVAAMALFAQ